MNQLTKIEIISIIAKEKMVENIISNIEKKQDDLFSDLAQDIYVSLLDKEDSLIKNLYNSKQLRYYVTKMVINNIHSKNSPFWSVYRKYINNAEELGDYTDGN